MNSINSIINLWSYNGDNCNQTINILFQWHILRQTSLTLTESTFYLLMPSTVNPEVMWPCSFKENTKRKNEPLKEILDVFGLFWNSEIILPTMGTIYQACKRNLVAKEYQGDAVEGDGRWKELWKLKFWSRHMFAVLLVLAIWILWVCFTTNLWGKEGEGGPGKVEDDDRLKESNLLLEWVQIPPSPWKNCLQ